MKKKNIVDSPVKFEGAINHFISNKYEKFEGKNRAGTISGNNCAIKRNKMKLEPVQ